MFKSAWKKNPTYYLLLVLTKQVDSTFRTLNWFIMQTRYIYNSERFEPRWVNVVVWVIVRVCSVVLRRTVVGVDWRFDNSSGSHHQSDHHSDDGFHSGCRNVSHHQQQSNNQQQQFFSGLHYKPGRSLKPQHTVYPRMFTSRHNFQKGGSFCHRHGRGNSSKWTKKLLL